MKRIKIYIGLLALAIMLISFSGCGGAKISQVNKTIEAGSGDVDPLTLINVENADQYEISVISNKIDTSKLGTYTVEYGFKDKKTQKESSKELTFEVADSLAPNINVIKDKDIKIEKGSDFEPLDYIEVKDDYEQDISKGAIKVENTVDTNKIGTYSVKYSVSDSSGNKATASLSVEVIKPMFKVGDTISLNKYDIIINSFKFNRTDSETQNGFYQYYNADDGETFLICSMTIKNNDDIKRQPFDIFGDENAMLGARLKYDDQYVYDSVAHGLENNWYDTFCNINPLTTNTHNLTFEVPIEVNNSGKSIVLELYRYSDESEYEYIRLQ